LPVRDGASRISADFCDAETHRRIRGGKRQSLARACGFSGAHPPRIVDATAGLGRDGFVLAALGAEVTLVERSPIVAALLHDAIERARLHPEYGAWLQQRTQLVVEDAATYLACATKAHDVVYLDPMYPHRRKSALPRKEMQVLRELLGEDNDADELLPLALQRAKRVVVKRPPWAAPLSGAKPHHTIDSKLARYDVYVGAATR
jgi:16S rRNA (guanine1516-N2)-methyltransferase